MNVEFFIARRLLKKSGASTVSIPIVKIALVGITLGVMIMLLSVFITSGFKKEISTKLSGFFTDIEVSSYRVDDTSLYGIVSFSDSLNRAILNAPGVRCAYPYIVKPAILKYGDEIHGLNLKGVDFRYDAQFFSQHLIAGKIPGGDSLSLKGKIVLSKEVADLLKVGVGDKVNANFIQNPPRIRPLEIVGIFDTGFREYDETFALCDLALLQKLNEWTPEEMTSIAVQVTDIDAIDGVANYLDEHLPTDSNNNYFRLTTLRQQAPQIYDWLELLNMNVWIILILVVAVAGFNMVSGLLILILDKTRMIGLLKSMGMRSCSLQKLFLYISVGLIWKGVLWGNVLALALAFLQWKFSIIPLDSSTYYMSTVPISVNWESILVLDIGVVVVSTLMLLVPTLLIGRISPISAIKFD